MNRCFSHALFAATLVLGVAPSLNAQDHGQHGHDHSAHEHAGHSADEAESAKLGDPYTLTTDPVTGEALPSVDKQIKVVHDGRELRFASEANHAAFEKTPKKFIEMLDAQVVADQLDHYPVDTCVVSSEPLGEEPIDFVYRNRLIRFCCKGCRGDFLKDPDVFLQKLDAAVVAKQYKNYPLKTCPVSKQELGSMGDPVDVVVANRLVRLCCAGCKAQLLEDPAGYLSVVDADAEAHGEQAPGHEGHQH